MSGNTNAYIILSVFTFYIFIGVLFGLIGMSASSFGTPETPSGVSFLSQVSYFFSGIGFTLSNLPLWANTLLFLPLGITLFYIVLSFFRGNS